MTRLPFTERRPPPRPRTARAALRVSVLGAGVAGLAAALQLERDGCEVTVVEARDEPGGRVRTARGVPTPGASFELGAARIGSHHLYTHDARRWLGLEVEPFYPQAGLLRREQGGRILREPVPGAGQDHAAHRTLTEGTSREDRSALAGLRDRVLGPRWDRVRGGTDLLPRGMAAALAAPVRYGTVVQAIEQSGATVRVECLGPGDRPVVLTADRVVCTLPFSVLRRIHIRPGLPADKREVVAGMGYQRAVRVALAIDPGWEASGWNGFGWSDRVGELWTAPTRDDAGGRILVWYAVGDCARVLGALPESRRHDDARAALDRFEPGLGGKVRGAVSLVWHEDPWAGGAQSQVWDFGVAALPVIRRPEGRIHFAGEHTATPRRLGWIDGALESGIRAAREIQEAR